jgi:hypothetical protein
MILRKNALFATPPSRIPLFTLESIFVYALSAPKLFVCRIPDVLFVEGKLRNSSTSKLRECRELKIRKRKRQMCLSIDKSNFALTSSMFPN